MWKKLYNINDVKISPLPDLVFHPVSIVSEREETHNFDDGQGVIITFFTLCIQVEHHL